MNHIPDTYCIETQNNKLLFFFYTYTEKQNNKQKLIFFSFWMNALLSESFYSTFTITFYEQLPHLFS